MKAKKLVANSCGDLLQIFALLSGFTLISCGGNGGGNSAGGNNSSVTLSIYGEVVGLRGTGLVLENNGASPLPISNNGAFSFTVPSDPGTYQIAVRTQPTSPSQSCVVKNGTRATNADPVSIVSVNCNWTRQIATPLDDITKGITTDGSGNIFVAGYTRGNLDENTNAGPQGTSDGFIVKYDMNGIRQWTRQFGTATADAAYAIATDGSGNVYVAGTTWGDLDGNSNANPFGTTSDVFVTKYDTNGNRLWTRQFGTIADDDAFGIAMGTNGDVFVAGSTFGDLDGNANADPSWSTNDFFVLKVDTNGTKLWTRQFGTPTWDYAFDIATDANGNLHVTGGTWGDLDGDGVSSGFEDIFVSSHDPNGNLLWVSDFGSIARGLRIAADASGNTYTTGITWGDLDGNSVGAFRKIFLVKFNAAGIKQWTRLLGPTWPMDALGPTEGRDLVIAPDGYIYVTGHTFGTIDGNPNANPSTKDLVVAKYDSNGNKIWSRLHGSTEQEDAGGIAAGINDDIFVTGSTIGSFDGNTNLGPFDSFVVKYTTDGEVQ